VAERVVADLEARGYLDDAAFARRWVEIRLARGYGPARLRAELRARGVAAAPVDQALAAIETEAAVERARAVARRRLAALRSAPPERRAGRLRDHLLRRGYPAPIVARILREMLGVDAAGEE